MAPMMPIIPIACFVLNLACLATSTTTVYKKASSDDDDDERPSEHCWQNIQRWLHSGCASGAPQPAPQCPICYADLDIAGIDPVVRDEDNEHSKAAAVFLCGHMMCHDCIIETQKTAAAANARSRAPPEKIVPPCPVCRSSTRARDPKCRHMVHYHLRTRKEGLKWRVKDYESESESESGAGLHYFRDLFEPRLCRVLCRVCDDRGKLFTSSPETGKELKKEVCRCEYNRAVWRSRVEERKREAAAAEEAEDEDEDRGGRRRRQFQAVAVDGRPRLGRRRTIQIEFIFPGSSAEGTD
ncbi:hypothetical protein B0H66DRAFT_536654 [Apodospora peruviana]|uniref:RING-type domain-containing protein n=1 Tax=Apodospora peruviana TaxID=516989 RepID=A0AAE0HV09_9PEZI|nr:hypothetical protein B0H66DRAFT_536654 [Apodospora peruviana]